MFLIRAFSYLSVKRAAELLACTEQRVRLLLKQGRLRGFKDWKGRWLVDLSLRVVPGKRGPSIRNNGGLQEGGNKALEGVHP